MTLPAGSRPYDTNTVPSLDYVPEHADSLGVPMQLVGGRLVYKPAGLAQLGVSYMNGYRVTGDPAYIEKAAAIASVFRHIAVNHGGALYLPYSFTFAMHGNPADTIKRPWYSAMAQGIALSLFARLYVATGDDSYRATATKLYSSICHIGRGTKPWVSYIGPGRYLWLEEYAQPQPEHTLNGFNFAVFGLYDWFLVTRDPRVLQTLRGALTTLKAYARAYRNPGHPSAYCLEHRVQAIKYHRIHIWQLRMMSTITKDPWFRAVATLLERDAR